MPGEPATYTKTGTVRNSFSVMGRSVYVYWDGEDDGIGHDIPASALPEGQGYELGEGSRVRVTFEVIEDRPAEPNPYHCSECGRATGHSADCPNHWATGPNPYHA